MFNINYLKQVGKFWFIPLVLIVFSSCTDVDETINSQVTPDQFFQNEQQFTSALGDAYAILGTGGGSAPGFGGHNGFTSMYEISADQVLIPHKGPDWFDGGQWLRMHQHEFKYDEASINGTWLFMFSGINSSNRLIAQFERLIEDGSVDEELATGFIAELEVLRSFYYLKLLDAFGNVPILTSFEGVEDPANNSNFQAGRTEVFEFVEKSITDNLDKLSTDVGSTVGRMNKFVAHMMLARLYMNAEVYIEEPKWQEALDQLNAVEDGGYSLADNYSANFVTNNSGSPEIIFAVPYDNVNLTGFNLHQMTLHYQQQAKFQMQSQPWNGYSTLSEFYNSHIDPEQNLGPEGDVIGLDGLPTEGVLDDRLANFSVGLQEDNSGNVITDASFATTNDASDVQRGTVDESPKLRLTPKLDELEPNANRQAGARITKYEIEPGALPDLNNDFVIYRYADVLLLKAEALMRLNSENDPMALQYVNQIRERAGVTPFTNLTFDKLLAERGREMFYEVTRRSDLIRFDGKEGATRFNDTWTFKDEVSGDYRNVFPIPQDQLEANSNLFQNPEYTGR